METTENKAKLLDAHQDSLVNACFEGNLEEVKHLIEEVGIDPSTWKEAPGPDNYGNLGIDSPIKAASSRGHISIVNFLLEKGANINAWRNGVLKEPINEAVENNQLEMVRFLLENGADANMPQFHKGSKGEGGFEIYPLELAVENENLEITKLLLTYGAKPNTIDFFNGESPLFTAVNKRILSLVELLLDYKADPGDFTKHDFDFTEADDDRVVKIADLLKRYRLTREAVIYYGKYRAHLRDDFYEFTEEGKCS